MLRSIKGDNVKNWKPYNIFYNGKMLVTGLKPLTNEETRYHKIKAIILGFPSKGYSVSTIKIDKVKDVINVYLN